MRNVLNTIYSAKKGECIMILPIVVLTDKKEAIDKPEYDHGMKEGLFLTEDGTIGIKRKDGQCFDIYGRELNIKGQYGYRCFIEGGNRGIVIPGETKRTRSGEKVEAHPGYGTITITRSQVNPPISLFGSSIKHGNLININISHAELKRGINHDWYHSNGRICEIELSLSQFADMITSIGNGDGVPCTIHFTESEGNIPRIDYKSKIEQHRAEFEDQLSDVKDLMQNTYNTVKELFETKKSLNKTDKEIILSALAKANRELGCNASYALDCFNEQMDKSITEARGEIEAFMQNQLHNVAMKAIATNIDEKKLPDFDTMIELE